MPKDVIEPKSNIFMSYRWGQVIDYLSPITKFNGYGFRAVHVTMGSCSSHGRYLIIEGTGITPEKYIHDRLDDQTILGGE
jgi:hypothetical protein